MYNEYGYSIRPPDDDAKNNFYKDINENSLKCKLIAKNILKKNIEPNEKQEKYFYKVKDNYLTPLSVTNNKIKEFVFYDSKQCVVCLENPSTELFYKCLHQCCCAQCYVNVLKTHRNCPICRTSINNDNWQPHFSYDNLFVNVDF
jgi:hypothetical protein